MSRRIKVVLAAVVLILIITASIYSDSSIDFTLKSWDEHINNIQSESSGFMERHVLMKDSSDISIATLVYNEGKEVDIYYPPDMDFSAPRPVLIIVGLSDIEIKNDYGKPYRHKGQAVGWAQVIAEAGIVVLAHETGNLPKKDLVALAEWIRTEGDAYGLDGNRFGLWSNSDACDTAVKGIRPDKNGIPRPSASFAVFYYGNLTAYSSMDPEVPILIVTAESDGWTDMARINRFIEKMRNLGSSVTHIHHSTGGHAFEIHEYNDETGAVIEQTISFMLKHSAASATP